MMKIKIFVCSIFASFFFLATGQGVFAATIYILPEQGGFGLNEEINVDVKIDSEGESINAAQASLRWSSDVLDFISLSKENSVFNFWVEEPSVSADKNSLDFIAGTAKGISGTSLQVLRLKFKTKNVGITEFSISDAAITASDGKGTNVLSKIKGASYRVGAEVIQPKTPESPLSLPQPLKVERTAVSVSKLPQKPEIMVPLYGDQQKWNNYSGDTVALWKVSDDVTAMAVVLDHNPNAQPTVAEKELTTGKKLGVLEDGVWFIHVRFRNNVGWGSVAHHRIAIDTKPPASFEVVASGGEVTDNPSPILEFKTSDALSGLKEYQIKIGDGELIKIPAADFNGSLKLPLQPPGTRQIIVKAFDQADNSVEDRLELEIIPISSPVITFVPDVLFSDEEKGFAIKGISLPSINIILRVYREEALVVEKKIQADERGNWDFTFDQTFKNGRYKITAQTQDERGALSLVVESPEIKIKSKPIIQIGFLQLGKGGAALLLLLILVAGFGSGIWFYKKQEKKLTMRVSFTESEITKIFQLINADIERFIKARETPTSGDDEYAAKRLQENIQKMEIYIQRGVEKIKK